MKKSHIVGCIALALLLVWGAPAVAQTFTPSQTGLSFTLVNECDGTVSGMAVGDRVCLLNMNKAFYMSTVFMGDIASGVKKWASACANTDGQAQILFVPPVTCSTEAVAKTVDPDERVRIPEAFCACSTGEMQDDALKMGD